MVARCRELVGAVGTSSVVMVKAKAKASNSGVTNIMAVDLLQQ